VAEVHRRARRRAADPRRAAGSDSVLVDVSERRVIRREHGVKPAASWWLAPGAQRFGRGACSSTTGALVRLDIATGARQILLGGS
jgi:hypothetical protein